MRHLFRIAATAGIICLGSMIQAASAEGIDTASLSGSTPGLSAIGLRFSGFTSSEFGQLENAYMLSQFTSHQDIMRTYVNFGVSKQISDRFQIQAAVEGKMYYNTFNQNEKGGVEGFFLPSMYYSFYFDRAFANLYLGDAASPYLQFSLGYFPFKYNPDARDLGEYLYRSGTYPAILFNQFDFALARLLGLKVSSDLGDKINVHQDLLLTASTDMPPFFDLNLGYIATFDFTKVFELGVGGMYQSLIPADENLTSPHTEFIGGLPASNGNAYNIVTDSNGAVVSANYYTAAGLKLMARFSFDPKRIFCPECDNFAFLGNEGLKLYGEASILGVQDYPSSQDNPYGYDTLMHKLPIMLGVNLPSFDFGKFTIFDVLTTELEYYGCTYPDNYQYKDQPIYQPVPVPSSQIFLGEHNYASLDNWKWAVYAKKTFKNGLFAVGQIACDHIRNESPVNNFYDCEEILRTNRSWWWVLKLGYNF